MAVTAGRSVGEKAGRLLDTSHCRLSSTASEKAAKTAPSHGATVQSPSASQATPAEVEAWHRLEVWPEQSAGVAVPAAVAASAGAAAQRSDVADTNALRPDAHLPRRAAADAAGEAELVAAVLRSAGTPRPKVA